MKYELLYTLSQLGNAGDLGIPKVEASQSTLNNVLSNTFFVVGALSMIFIVVGGLKFVLSAGNPDGVKKARETILYSLIGLVISLFAFAIVNFILSSV